MNLHVYYQNCRGLRSKLPEFRTGVLAGDYDIICITETNLLNHILDSELCDLGRYSVFRRDRATSASTKKDGGGVLLMVRDGLRAVTLPGFQTEAEDLWVLVSVSDREVLSMLRVSPSA